MSERAIKFGAPVQASDGPAGTVSGITIEPGARRVMELVVEPHHRHHDSHLISVDLVEPGDGGEGLTLRCTVAELSGSTSAVETDLRPAHDPQPFQSEAGGSGAFHAAAQAAPGFVSDARSDNSGPARQIDEDVVPAGEVELRKGTVASASDYQPVAQVRGLDVDADWTIVAVELAPHHLHRDHHVAIPIADVAVIEPDIVRLALSAEDVRGL